MSIERLLKNLISNGEPKDLFLQVRDEHHVHLLAGQHWKYSDRDAALATSASMLYLIKNGDHPVEFTFVVYGEGESNAQFFEAPTVSIVGTVQTAYNHNRTAEKVPSVTIYKTPTVSVNGVSLLHVDAGSGAAPGHAGAGGASTEHDPWVLRPNTDYLLKFINTSGVTIVANVQIDWFEHVHTH